MRIDQIVKVKRKNYIENDKVGQWYKDGYNACKEEYDSKEIEFNKEELYEAIRNTELVSDDMAGEIAEALTIADNLEKVLRVR